MKGEASKKDLTINYSGHRIVSRVDFSFASCLQQLFIICKTISLLP